MSTLCRACRASIQTPEVFLLKSDLLKRFTFVSCLEVELSDGLTQFVCRSCKISIDDFYEFKSLCAVSDALLRESKLQDLSLSVDGAVAIMEPFIKIEDNYNDDPQTDLLINYESSDYDRIGPQCIQDEGPEQGIALCGQPDEHQVHLLGTMKKELKRFHCTTCGKKFNRKFKFDCHVKEHLGLKGAVCQHCGKEFRTHKYLNFHIRQTHTDNIRTWTCPFEGCGKLFKSGAGLHLHKKAEHVLGGREIFMCSICGKNLSTKASLTEHTKIHSGEEKPLFCDRCPKRFNDSHALKVHIMRHDNVRNFVCQLCGARKVSKTELTYHMRDRHATGEEAAAKKHMCSNCGACFRKSSTLKHHMMRHEEVKPHSCQYCHKGFIQKHAMLRHQKDCCVDLKIKLPKLNRSKKNKPHELTS